ncbi:hypothetical protein ACX3U0_05595 [Aerococcus urinae]
MSKYSLEFVSNKKELAKGQLTIYKVQLIGVTIFSGWVFFGGKIF